MTAASEIQFLRNIQRLLDEGDFVATYKFALLQALADLSVEGAVNDGEGLRLPLERIAEKFIEYYWQQVVPFRPTTETEGILLQNPKGQAEILTSLINLRSRHNGNLASARRDRNLWPTTVRSVAATVRKMPLWKLQVIAGKPEEFLYQRSDYQSGTILLFPGVPSHFRSFHGLILRLVRGRWVEHVRTMRANLPIIGATADLESFLFGSERKTLDGYRTVLHDIDGSKCFYCDGSFHRPPEVDHFIPWSRYPIDLGHNFVLAHASCNLSKRDFLANLDHLQRWAGRNQESGALLAKAFDDVGLPHDLERTFSIARWAYSQGEVSGAHAWRPGGEFVKLDVGWQKILPA